MAVQDPDQQPQPTNPTVQRLIKAAAAGEAAKAAAGAAVAPGVAVTLPARAAVAAISVPVEAFAHGVKIAVILSVLRRLLKRTHADSADWLTKQLRKQFPDADPSVIRQAVERELKFEEAFQQKALVRVEADLHKAGALTTPEARQKRVNGILAREKHYAELREKAMLNRAKGFVQNAGVKAISPNGAKWVLGNRKNHTLGCLALAGKNWPWEVLDTIAPPLHSNCGCELKPLGPTDTVPPVGDAMAMAKAALALEEAIRVVAAPGEVDLYLAGRALLEASGESLQEINWSEWLHPRGRGGKWMDKLEPEPHKPEHEPKPKEPDLPKVPKPDPHMPKLSPESTVVSGPKPEGEKILGGDVPEPAHQGPIPSFDHIPLKLQLPPAFGADHIKAKGGDQTYFVKDYGGDRSQVASELLANAVYRELGVDVPTMGHVRTAPEPDFAQRTEDLPNEPPIDAEPNARISTGIILREPDGRMTLIEPRNHYGGYIHTFPKGGVESNLTPQQNAHKELWEETGLHAHITGVVGDFKGDTGTSRFYLGVRTGGDPTPSDETQAIKTVTPDEAAQMLNKQRDQDILKALLEQPIPEGTFEDAFPPEAQGSALAVPGVDGKTKEITAPNEALGRGYMADALLGNRNFLGQRGENIRWPNENTPVRTNMGSTLGYGARGKHEFGSTPEEVWTMRTRGQAAGTVPQGEDELRQQASDIAKILTDAKIDELTKAAPFPDPKERKQIAKTLKARVAWMRRFADGSESLPTPASGAEARAQFADAQDGFEIYPEERQAMEEYAGDAGRTLDGRLTSGKNFTDADRKLAKRLDSVLEASRAPVDSHVYVGAPGEPKAGMVGKAFSMKPYIRAHTEMTNAKGQMRMRLLVPGDARALHLEDAPKGEPDMLLPRGQRIQVTGMRTGPDGVPQLDGIVLPYQNPPRIPSDWKPSGVMGQTTIAGLGPKVPKGEIFKKGDRVDVNGNKATVTGDAGKGMANVKLDSGKGYTVPFKILKRLEEASYAEVLHPRGRGGRWITKPFQRDTPSPSPWVDLAKPSAIDAGVEYAKRAFDSSYHWPNPEAEKGNDGVTKYVEDGYAEINGALRHADKVGPVDPGYEIEAMGGDLPMRLDGAIKSIDAAIAGSRTKEDVTVFRGMDHREFGKLRVGDEIEPPAYSSTSLRQSQGSGWGDTLVEIRVPKGSHALAMDQAGFGGSENEVLLPRATRMRVVSTDPLTMEVVSQPKTPPPIPYDEPAAKKAERAQRRAQAQAIAKATKVGQKVTTRPGTQWARDVAVTAVDTDRGLLELGKGYWVDATDPKLGLAEAAGGDRRDKYVWQPGDFRIYRNGNLLEAAQRQCLLEVGCDLTEAFDPAQPRGRGGKWIFKGKLFTNQEAGKHMADRVLGWREHEGRAPEADTPSPERIAANWTKQLRGRLSKDREAIGAVAQASRVNEASPRWQALTHNRPADLVLVTKEPTKGKFGSLVDTQHAAHRVGATTIIPEENVKAEVAEGGITGNKKPSEHPSATSAYGLAGVLRHEYGHSVDDALPRDQRRHILDAIPDPGKDLGYYAGIRDNEMIPELIATITHPDYDPKDFPATVQEAERRLWKALGIDPEVVAKAVREHNLEGDWKGNEAAMADAQRALRAVTDRYDVPTKNVRIDKDMTEDVGRFAGKSKNTIYVSPHIVDEEYMAKRKKEFAGTMVEVPNDPTGRVRTITHEYGHILDGELLSNHKDAYAKLDAFLNEQGSYGMPGTRTRLQAGLEAPSAYGTTNRYEFVAEALTDWIHNGDKAHPSSQAIGKIFDQYLGHGGKLQEAGSVADFREWLHPRGRGGKWIEGTRREAPAAATAIKAIASPSAPPVKESLARIEALGISVVPPGKKSKFSPKEIADIADVFEEAFKQYPILDHGPGAPIRRVEFTSGGHGKLKPGVLADTGIRPASTKQAGWNIPTGSNITVLRFNDSYGYGLKPAGPPPPNAATGGSLAPSNSSWAGIAWHELGHAMMNAIDMAGHHDSKRYVDWMARYGVSFEDCKNVSTYAVASRSEGIAELCSMENTPGYSGLLDPELEGKAHQMFEDLRNWDVGTPYAYQKPLIANPKPTPKIKAKAPTTPKPPSKTTPTYAMPPPSQLAEIEAAVKASPGTAGVKMPVAEMDLNPGDVFEGSTPGLRYLVIADPSEKNGLRYVPLNQGKANAYRFSSTSKRRKVDLHFELQEGEMTIDTSPETMRKIDAAAARNLEAGDWVAPDPLLDQNDPPTPAVQESIYTEGLHPRGRGGKWIGKGIRARPAPKERTLASVPEPAPERAPAAPKAPTSKSPVDTIIESLGGKKGDEGYQALASGAATDTQKIYQVDGKYTEDRQALHQKIIDHFFADAKPAEGKAKAIFTAGGAASGKSALAGQSKPENNLDIPEGAVYINPDDIKEMLPEYNALKKQGREDVAAAATHEESSDLAKLMTALAMDGNYPVIVDGTGDSKVGKFGGKLKAAADAGYDVEARYAHVPVDEAIKREAIRAERTGRKVATTLLREQHKTVAQSYKDVMKNQPGVHVKVYSTIERGKPKLIAESPPGAPVHILHKQHYADHLAKADA